MHHANVILVEDDEATRDYIAGAIDIRPDLTLLGSAGTCAEGRTVLAEQRPDVLLTDLGLPDGSGIELISLVRELWPDCLIMVVTVFADERTLFASLEAGATGYVLKNASPDEIGDAIVALVAGGSPMSPPIAQKLLARFNALTAPAEPPVPAAGAPTLTEREREVLKLIAKGFSYAEASELLDISRHTVTAHLRNVYAKLEVGSRNAAVYEAVQLGLISLDE